MKPLLVSLSLAVLAFTASPWRRAQELPLSLCPSLLRDFQLQPLHDAR